MAGIGFVLRKLYRQDSLSSLLRVYLHAAVASTGPWLFTVLALGFIAVLSKGNTPKELMFEFRTLLIYNFAFSLVVAGPIYMVATRYLADCIHHRDVSSVPGMLIGALGLLWLVAASISGAFYFLYADLPFTLALSAVINFLLVSAVWLISIFLSALKNYERITRAFLFGMIIAVIATLYLGKMFGVIGLLNGFSLGICTILALLAANVLSEYPYAARQPLNFMHYFKKYRELALTGLVYNMAIWADKWVMWLAPEAVKLPNRLVVYPTYDSAMFIAFLSAVPAMAMFLFASETHFFERYRRFYRSILQKSSMTRIEQEHQAVIRSIFGSAGYFFVMQTVLALVGMWFAPKIIGLLGGHYMQIGMLRYGFAGVLFQVLTLFLLILLSYFDNRKASLRIGLLFLCSNTLLTWASLQAGYQYYGYGYFLATFLTFIVATMITFRHVAMLPYHTFITVNTSIAVPEKSA